MKYQTAIIKTRNDLHATYTRQCGEVSKLTKSKQRQFIRLCKYSSMTFDGGKCTNVYNQMLRKV